MHGLNTRGGLTRREAVVAAGSALAMAAVGMLAGCVSQTGEGVVGSDSATEVPANPEAASDAGNASDQGALAQASQVEDVSGDSGAPTDPADAGAVPGADLTAVASYGRYRPPEERMATSDSANDQIPGEHVVFLTFDDGPSTNTDRILQILDDYGVKATWFVMGVQGGLDHLPDIWARGHQIAIHTWSHEYEQIYASTDAYWADLQQVSDAIQERVGFAPTLVRFPGGSVNDFNRAVRADLLWQFQERGYHYFDWNVSCGDGADHTADELVGYTLAEAANCHSCCVLMHDSPAKDTTVEALPRIIEYFISEGFVFDVLLSDTYGYHF